MPFSVEWVDSRLGLQKRGSRSGGLATTTVPRPMCSATASQTLPSWRKTFAIFRSEQTGCQRLMCWLPGFVRDYTQPITGVYTDEFSGYNRLPRSHKVIRHSAKEFVRGEVHTNGIESWFSMLKRGYIGVYHNFSVKHLPRYLAEYVTRHNLRPLDTEAQTSAIIRGAIDKRLPYLVLIGEPHTRQPELI